MCKRPTFHVIILAVFHILFFTLPAIGQQKNLTTDYPEFFSQSDFEVRLTKASKIVEIIDELAEMRSNFIKTGNFIDIFPTVYFHTTSLQFELILSNKTENPLEMMDLVIDFYEIYKRNRIAFIEKGIVSVEPHWTNYYKSAVEANSYRARLGTLFKPMRMLWKVKTVVSHGFVAHIDYDLEKSLGKILGYANVSKDSIYRDFRLADSVMLRADSKAINDFAKAMFKRTRFFAKLSLNFGQFLFCVSSNILKKRLNAWKHAT